VFVNGTRWSTPETDNLMNQAAVELNSKNRAAIYHDFQKRIVDASPIVFVHELDFVTVHNKKVQNFLVSPLGLYSAFDQAWLQK